MNELERKRWYPFQDIMDKDDEKYIQQGHTFVDLREDFYDNCTTKGDEEMNEERKKRKSISNDESREKVDHMANKVIVAGAMLLQVMV